MDFSGKAAFVTGVSHGIGRAIALGLAKNKAALFLCDIDKAGLKETAKAVNELGAQVEICGLDVSDEAAVHAVMDKAILRLAKLIF